MAITGGCLCKAVRYEISSQPVGARTCWCRVCQYFAAGNATVNAVFKQDTVTVTGDLEVYKSKADSGNRMGRAFCPECGTQIFSESSGRPGFVVVRAGTLDDPNIVKPTMTIWTASAPKYACIDETIPKVEGQPK